MTDRPGGSLPLAAAAVRLRGRPGRPPMPRPVASQGTILEASETEGARRGTPDLSLGAGHNAGHSVAQPRVTTRGRRRAQDGASSGPARASVLRAAPETPDRRLWSIQEAAGYLGVSVWTLREMHWRGDLPAIRLPRVRRLLFDRLDLDRLIDAWKERPGA